MEIQLKLNVWIIMVNLRSPCWCLWCYQDIINLWLLQHSSCVIFTTLSGAKIKKKEKLKVLSTGNNSSVILGYTTRVHKDSNHSGSLMVTCQYCNHIWYFKPQPSFFIFSLAGVGNSGSWMHSPLNNNILWKMITLMQTWKLPVSI